jgi:hypothetical protein
LRFGVGPAECPPNQVTSLQQSYLPAGVERHGRRWPRRVIVDRIEQGDQREHPEHTGAGRPKSTPERPNRGRAGNAGAAPDPRVLEVAADLARAAAENTKPSTGAELATRYRVSRTTGATILRAARTHLSALD